MLVAAAPTSLDVAAAVAAAVAEAAGAKVPVVPSAEE